MTGHDLIDSAEVGHVGHRYIDFYRIGEAATGGLCDGAEIAKHLLGLFSDATFDNLHGLWVQWDLTGYPYRVSYLDGL